MDLATLSPNLNDRGPLIGFLHQTTLLHSYWLLLTPNALPQPISFVLVKIMFHSLIWVVFWLSILHPLRSTRHSCLALANLSLLYLTRFHYNILFGSTLHLKSISFRHFSRSNIILIADMCGK